MALGELSAKTQSNLAQLKLDAEESGAIGGFFADVLTSQAGSIASKVLGSDNEYRTSTQEYWLVVT